MISPEMEDKLERALQSFELSDSTQVAILTLDSLEGDSLEDFSIRTVEKWKIGQKNKDNGVLLLVFKNDRKIDTIFNQYIAPGPGPGKYLDNRSGFIPKKRYKNKKGQSHFISAERRFFHEPENIKNPGPGKYFEEKDPLAINGPRPKFDANFGSKSNRKIEEFMVNNPNSPLYNLQEFNSIGQRRTTNRAPNNFTIMYKKEAPFMTSSPRFRGEDSGTVEEVGPGKYEKKNSLLNKLINEALKQRIPRMPFNQSEGRFKSKQFELPGPGTYNADKNKWEKQTFNLRFIK